uniref:aryl-sulfate sulfotransferase n=1 Tax=Candidatus Ventrenecus sp. TaxID=3085654 RepID=UPI0040251043
MKKKNFLLLGVGVVLILFLGAVFLEIKNTADTPIDKTISLVEKQTEKDYNTEGYTIDNPNVVLNPYDISPLSALVLFETEQEEAVKVTIKGKDALTTYTHTFEATKKHFLPIYGLYADKENEVVISYGKVSKTIKIKTDKLPDDISLPTSVVKDASKLTNDLYFYTPSSKGYTAAYDVNGDVRWYLTINSIWEVNRLQNGHLLLSTERLVNSPYYMTGLYEMDMLGKIYTEYSLEGGYHHDYYEMENGNLIVASDNFANGKTVEDYVVELDRKTGKIVKTWDISSILNHEDGKSENWSEYDWFHNNAVWYDKKTNSITLSGRHQDAVINISYDDGSLNWIIGDKTNWSEDYQKYFFTPKGKNFEWQWSQHAAMITPEGYVFLFDNGNNKSKIESEYVDASKSYSRGVMYKIDTENMTIEQVYEYGKERGSSFYSPYISDVDYLASNHYIVHSGGIVYVDGKNSNQPAGFSNNASLVSDTVELLNNKVIFEMKFATNNYRVEKMSLYAENEKYSNDKAVRLGSLGKTEIAKKSFNLNLFVQDIDDDYNNKEISITEEVDRFVFKGKFKRGTKVNLILYHDLTYTYYNVPVSKKPYTALCVDIFTEKEQQEGITVTKYINKEGLKEGTYQFLVEIDGKIYNTGRYGKINE